MILPKANHPPIEQFAEFAKNVALRTPRSEQSLTNRYARTYSSIRDKKFTKEEINDILASGNPVAIRQISLYFARYSGIYTRTM